MSKEHKPSEFEIAMQKVAQAPKKKVDELIRKEKESKKKK